MLMIRKNGVNFRCLKLFPFEYGFLTRYNFEMSSAERNFSEKAVMKAAQDRDKMSLRPPTSPSIIKMS